MESLLLTRANNYQELEAKIQADPTLVWITVSGEAHKFTLEELFPLLDWVREFIVQEKKLLTWVFKAGAWMDGRVWSHVFFPTSKSLEKHIYFDTPPIGRVIDLSEPFNLYMEGDDNHPEIIADTEQGFLKIGGEFYTSYSLETINPIFYWLEKYLTESGKSLRLEFWMTYINTSARRRFIEILKFLEDYKKNAQGKIEVYWYYLDKDIDMKELGMEMEEELEQDHLYLNFTLTEVDEDLWKKMNKNPFV